MDGKTRLRHQLATGEKVKGLSSLPSPSKTPRYRRGGAVDKTEYQRYGNGFRRSSRGSK